MILSKPVGQYRVLVLQGTWNQNYTILIPPTYSKTPFYACQTKIINGNNTIQILVDYLGELVWINVDSNPNNIIEVDV